VVSQEVTADESHELVAAFSMTVMLTILLLVIILGATIKHYNISWLHQSGAALLLGVLVGFVVSYVRRDPMYMDNTRESQRMTSFVEWIMFDTEFFFLVLLPPVIFESGYTLNPETLFKNFDAISVFAFLGTFTSTLVVGAIMYFSGHLGFSYPFTLRDAMLFASLISSTDPVTTLAIFSDMGLDPDLHAVVLGESLLNDAISIVLFEALFSFGKPAPVVMSSTSDHRLASLDAAGALGRDLSGALAEKVMAGTETLGAQRLSELSAAASDLSGLLGNDGGFAGVATSPAAIGTEVAFSELAVTTLVAFCGVFVASLIIGGMVGACSAMLHKYISITGDWDEGWVIDSALVLIFPYLAYTIAESANLSGIVAVLFCGMVMGRYTRQNLDKAPRMVTMCFFKLVAFLSETFVFIYMGSSMCTISVNQLGTAFVSLLAVFVGRAANIFPGAALLNKTLRPTPEDGALEMRTQLCLWYCGLRGAVAYALAMKAAATLGAPGEAMLGCTLFVVMFTVILMGGSTTWALQRLGIIDHAPSFGGGDGAAEEGGQPAPKGSPGRGETPKTARANTRSYRALRQFDFKYLQPLLLAVPMKRLPKDDANAAERAKGERAERGDGGGTNAGTERDRASGSGGVSRRVAGSGNPPGTSAERSPLNPTRRGGGGGEGASAGDNGSAGQTEALWGSGAV
jgi:NhaP-type Na+/H+ or K+/H+ antiporter